MYYETASIENALFDANSWNSKDIVASLNLAGEVGAFIREHSSTTSAALRKAFPDYSYQKLTAICKKLTKVGLITREKEATGAMLVSSTPVKRWNKHENVKAVKVYTITYTWAG